LHQDSWAFEQTVDQAEIWLRGEADLIIAGMGRRVPLLVQLGVLAHADLERLCGLGRYCRRGSVRRTWGSDMARLAGDLAASTGTPEALRGLQRELLIPLELEVLGGRHLLSDREDLIRLVRSYLATRRN